MRNIKQDETELNIIYSFNFGFKEWRAFKSGGEFKFNGMTCDISKSPFDFNKFSSIIFYTNIYVSNKFNVSIISPYLFTE